MPGTAGAPAKAVPPRPPDKGSFPLDHFGECSAAKAAYLDCLKQNDLQGDGAECRRLSAAYLQCRMDSKLMAREELNRLGYADRVLTPSEEQPAAPRTTAAAAKRQGFVAGMRSRE